MSTKANPPSPSSNGAAAHATHVEPISTEPSPNVPAAHAVKLSVNVTREVGLRLRRIAFDERVSESSIVEIALEGLFGNRSDAQLGTYLREKGASLRRPVREAS